MKITQQQLKDWSACTDGYEWACGILKDKPMEVKEFLKITADHRLDWANWVICRVFDRPNKVRYAIFAAEQVIHLFEKKYSDDKRPRKAIEAAKAWLENPSAASAAYADSAAYAASAASAASAAYAASAASAAYADSAAYAAYAASADSAAYEASREQMQIKILKYGLSLLD